MKPLTITTQPDGSVILQGDLTFATINKKTARLLDAKKNQQPVVIDFAQVNHSDSAGLALLIEWLKIGKAAGREIRFNHTPQQLLTLAKLSGFDMAPYFSE